MSLDLGGFRVVVAAAEIHGATTCSLASFHAVFHSLPLQMTMPSALQFFLPKPGRLDFQPNLQSYLSRRPFYILLSKSTK